MGTPTPIRRATLYITKGLPDDLYRILADTRHVEIHQGHEIYIWIPGNSMSANRLREELRTHSLLEEDMDRESAHQFIRSRTGAKTDIETITHGHTYLHDEGVKFSLQETARLFERGYDIEEIFSIYERVHNLALHRVDYRNRPEKELTERLTYHILMRAHERGQFPDSMVDEMLRIGVPKHFLDS